MSEYAKEYRKKHRDHLIEYNKQYYQKNKEILNQIKNRIVECVCGSNISFNNHNRHKNSFKHKNFLSNNEQETN